MAGKHYVVWWCERMRDGNDEVAQIVASEEAAVALIDKIANGFAGSDMEFKIFELGNEIPLERDTTEKPRPPVTATRYAIKKRGK